MRQRFKSICAWPLNLRCWWLFNCISTLLRTKKINRNYPSLENIEKKIETSAIIPSLPSLIESPNISFRLAKLRITRIGEADLLPLFQLCVHFWQILNFITSNWLVIDKFWNIFAKVIIWFIIKELNLFKESTYKSSVKLIYYI